MIADSRFRVVERVVDQQLSLRRRCEELNDKNAPQEKAPASETALAWPQASVPAGLDLQIRTDTEACRYTEAPWDR
jgi:hypothetical protein